ncbi:hypothetical protein MJO28_008697 [Puccinia striiformis f. sp. tritici]|uniref:Uncharacterized protein n=1 Tax=Puccinia striiformis f. sp. tritici TaxID=168172 RepID=A0ACC0EB47_9BASI|nr:hypothetical protein MJO28_008697 [Puccinia striiformis f. sp. tritici]
MIPVATVGPPSVGILECNPRCKWPASVIDCKRGMVLRLLDNTGHDELKVSDWLLLIAITTSSLVVKPLTGVTAGLNVHLQRLEYVPPPPGSRYKRNGSRAQYPVVGGFAVENNDEYRTQDGSTIIYGD